MGPGLQKHFCIILQWMHPLNSGCIVIPQILKNIKVSHQAFFFSNKAKSGYSTCIMIPVNTRFVNYLDKRQWQQRRQKDIITVSTLHKAL